MAEAPPQASAAESSTESCDGLPTVVIVLGMAGSGKSCLMQRIVAHQYAKKEPPYVINLDPACHECSYPVNIDIKDTVNYKEVMKQYNLGPNGGIMTSLNLFSTKFDEVLSLVGKIEGKSKHVLIDTPGQIEVFTWSASGTIITEALATRYPTVIVYVMDTPRSENPVTFMSNMLYACSILYKTKLPFLIALNKIDVMSHQFALDWMRDFECFQQALDNETSYVSNLTRSMSLVLDDFYSNIKTVGVSALEGIGITEFYQAIDELRMEYIQDYKPEYDKMLKEKLSSKRKENDGQLATLRADLASAGDGREVPVSCKVTRKDLIEVKHRDTGMIISPDDDNSSEDERVDDDMEEDEAEKLEYASFKRFLASEMGNPNQADT